MAACDRIEDRARGRRGPRAPRARRRSCRPATSPRRAATRDVSPSRRAGSPRRAASGRRAARRVVARQADEHAGLDHRLGDEEHVRRSRARQAGDRVELRLGRRARRCRPRRAPARRSSRCELGRRARRRRSRPRRVPTSAPVLGIARTTGRPGASASSVGDRDPGRDRQHERAARAAPAAQRVERGRRRRPASPRRRRRRRRPPPTPGSARRALPGAAPRARAGARRRPRRSRASSGSQPPSSRPPPSASPIRPPPSSARLHPAVRVTAWSSVGHVARRDGARARGTLGPAPHFPERSGPPAPRARHTPVARRRPAALTTLTLLGSSRATRGQRRGRPYASRTTGWNHRSTSS